MKNKKTMTSYPHFLVFDPCFHHLSLAPLPQCSLSAPSMFAGFSVFFFFFSFLFFFVKNPSLQQEGRGLPVRVEGRGCFKSPEGGCGGEARGILAALDKKVVRPWLPPTTAHTKSLTLAPPLSNPCLPYPAPPP